MRTTVRALSSALVLGLALGLAVLPSGCKKKAPATVQRDGGQPDLPPPPEPEDPAVADIPYDPDAPEDPARAPKAPQRKPLEVAARLILITHAGTEKPSSKRSEVDAQKRAVRLTQLARQAGADFAALAKKHSEAPEEGRGKIDIFREGDEIAPAFIDAAMTMGEGQVSEPVRTKFGYYVIMREPIEEYSTAHILIVYKGAERAPPAFKRTKEAARKKADLAARKAAKPGVNFALLADRYSDSPSKLRGGIIGRIRPDSLIPGFEPYLEAVRSLEEGGVSAVVETPYGFHVIKRLPLEKILMRHIVIGFNGARDTQPREKRSKVQARDLAAKLHEEALKEGVDFAALAKEHSDGPAAPKGGLFPPVARGELGSPRVEQFAFALDPGQVSDVVESEFGYHIVKRLR